MFGGAERTYGGAAGRSSQNIDACCEWANPIGQSQSELNFQFVFLWGKSNSCA